MAESPRDKAWSLEHQFHARWKSHLSLCSRCRQGDDYLEPLSGVHGPCPQGSHLHHTWQHWLTEARQPYNERRP